jgi:hypothetical protein
VLLIVTTFDALVSLIVPEFKSIYKRLLGNSKLMPKLGLRETDVLIYFYQTMSNSYHLHYMYLAIVILILVQINSLKDPVANVFGILCVTFCHSLYYFHHSYFTREVSTLELFVTFELAGTAAALVQILLTKHRFERMNLLHFYYQQAKYSQIWWLNFALLFKQLPLSYLLLKLLQNCFNLYLKGRYFSLIAAAETIRTQKGYVLKKTHTSLFFSNNSNTKKQQKIEKLIAKEGVDFGSEQCCMCARGMALVTNYFCGHVVFCIPCAKRQGQKHKIASLGFECLVCPIC